MEIITGIAIVALVVVVYLSSRERLEIIKIMKAKNIDEVLAISPKEQKEVVELDDGRFVAMEDMPLSFEKEE